MSTKKCGCGNTDLVLLTSIDQKLCVDCGSEIHWVLDEGQASLHGSSRANRTPAPKVAFPLLDSFDEERIDRIAASAGDGEHYAELA